MKRFCLATVVMANSCVRTNYFKRNQFWSNHSFTWMGTYNKIGIRYINKSHFDFNGGNGNFRNVSLPSYKSLENELGAQKDEYKKSKRPF